MDKTHVRVEFRKSVTTDPPILSQFQSSHRLMIVTCRGNIVIVVVIVVVVVVVVFHTSVRPPSPPPASPASNSH